MAMFSFIEKLREKFFKSKNQQEKRARTRTDEYEGKMTPARQKLTGPRPKIHRGGMFGNKFPSKLSRKMARKSNYGGVAYRVTANSSPESRKAARRALA